MAFGTGARQCWREVGHQQHSRNGLRFWARRAATDAANYFTGDVNPATLEQFGATAGGPIIKDKLFWFAGYEGLRLAYGDPSQVAIPVDVGRGNASYPAAAAASEQQHD